MGVFFGAKRARGAGARGPTREIARGGAAAGKKLGHDGFVRAGDVHRSNAKAGVRPQRRTAAVLSMPDPLQARRRPCARCSPGRCTCVHSGIGKPHARPRCRYRLLSRRHRATWSRRAEDPSVWTAGLRERFQFGFDNRNSRNQSGRTPTRRRKTMADLARQGRARRRPSGSLLTSR